MGYGTLYLYLYRVDAGNATLPENYKLVARSDKHVLESDIDSRMVSIYKQVRAGISSLLGSRQYCGRTWHVSSHSGEASRKMLYQFVRTCTIVRLSTFTFITGGSVAEWLAW